MFSIEDNFNAGNFLCRNLTANVFEILGTDNWPREFCRHRAIVAYHIVLARSTLWIIYSLINTLIKLPSNTIKVLVLLSV